MAWERALSDLADLFASLIRDPSEAETVATRIGLDPANLKIYGQKPSVFWMHIVEEADNQQLVQKLRAYGKQKYPKYDFPNPVQTARLGPIEAPKPGDEEWKAPDSDAAKLEKLMGDQSTLLPISFLELGLRRARSVAKVETPSGSGTGFLTHGNLLITNHHVIPTVEAARNTKVRFRFEENADGLAQESVPFDLDPEGKGHFATSPEKSGDDWTAVRVQGDANKDWGALDLDEKVTIKANDFVNIIQHPAGLPKQIALYHNLVAHVDTAETRVQYLTDTRPGSSGAPVFDTNWRVVALHQSGGWLAQAGSKELFFRNQGIHVRALVGGLKQQGMLTA
jgi:V8-like Glu-specific endopeptidase